MKKILFLLLIISQFTCALEAPEGWRFPNSKDYTGEWDEIFRGEDNVYVPVAVSDFDLNNLDDEAWILFSEDGSQWGVFVFLSYDNKVIVYPLAIYESVDGSAQLFNISIISPGPHTINCVANEEFVSSYQCSVDSKAERSSINQDQRITITNPAVILRNNEYSNGSGQMYWLHENEWVTVFYIFDPFPK